MIPHRLVFQAQIRTARQPTSIPETDISVYNVVRIGALMARLDLHIAAVRRKLTTALFFDWLARCALAAAAVVLLGILITRLFPLDISGKWILGAGAAAIAVAAFLAMLQRPTLQTTAIEIDRRLGLKERFSTALLVRGWKDPFARAVALDAESAAVVARPMPKFPLTFPRTGYWAIVVALLALLSLALPTWRGNKAIAQVPKPPQPAMADPAKPIEKALERLDNLPKKAQDLREVKDARTRLEQLKKQKDLDEPTAARKAAEEFAKIDKAMAEAAQSSPAEQQWEKDMAMSRSLSAPEQDQGPAADAHRKLSQGQYADAAKDIEQATKNFDKQTPQEQQKTQEQMQNIAKQLDARANDPRPMKELANKLEQIGASKDQTQKVQELIKKSAEGDKDAQKQLQDMQKQIADQRNDGKGSDKKQQEQLKQAMDQAQGECNSQNNAGKLSKLATRIAKAMGQKGQQSQNQMNQAADEMKEALEGMQANANNAADMKEARQAIADAQAEAAAQCNSPGGNPGAQGSSSSSKGDGAGNSESNSAGMQNSGGTGAGQAVGKRADAREAAYTTKKEKSVGKLDEKGKFIARQFIQGSAPKGESTLEVQKVIETSEAESAEQVDDTRADPRSRQVMKEYFNRLKQQAAKQK